MKLLDLWQILDHPPEQPDFYVCVRQWITHMVALLADVITHAHFGPDGQLRTADTPTPPK